MLTFKKLNFVNKKKVAAAIKSGQIRILVFSDPCPVHLFPDP